MTAYSTPTMSDPTAVMGRRIFAYVIDGIIATVILAIILVPAFLDKADKVPSNSERVHTSCPNSGSGSFKSNTGNHFCFDNGDETYILEGDGASQLQAEAWGLSFGMLILNSVIIQGLTGGTIGKLLLGLRVAKQDGSRAGFGSILIRSLLLLLDGFCCFLIGLITSMTTKGHRRVGDMAANTYVVPRSQLGQPLRIPGVTSGYGTPGYDPGYPTGGAYPPPGGGATWGTPGPAATPGWAPPGQAAPTAAPGPTPGGADGPQWDQARNAYIQYDRAAGAWKQWDDATSAWVPISQ